MTKFLTLRLVDGNRSDIPSVPTAVSTDKIRNVHPRKYGHVGTRIVFENNTAIIVSDSYQDVVEKWTGTRPADEPAGQPQTIGQMLDDDSGEDL